MEAIPEEEEIGQHLSEDNELLSDEWECDDVTVSLPDDVDDAMLHSFQPLGQHTERALPPKKRHRVEILSESMKQTTLATAESSVQPEAAQSAQYLAQCEHCGVELPTGELTVHMVTHFDDQANKCVICSSVFQTEQQLQEHMGTHTMTSQSPDVQDNFTHTGSYLNDV